MRTGRGRKQRQRHFGPNGDVRFAAENRHVHRRHQCLLSARSGPAEGCEIVGLISKTNLSVRLVQNTDLSGGLVKPLSCYDPGSGESVVSEVTIYHNPHCGRSRNVLASFATLVLNRPSLNI